MGCGISSMLGVAVQSLLTSVGVELCVVEVVHDVSNGLDGAIPMQLIHQYTEYNLNGQKCLSFWLKQAFNLQSSKSN